MTRWASITLLIAIFLGIGIPDIALAQAPAQPPIIREIVIRGFEHLPQTTQENVRKAITSQVGQQYSEQTARADELALLRTGFLFSARHSTEPVENGVRLVFTVVENPVITQVEFVGNTALSSAFLAGITNTKAGQVLNRDVIAQDINAIKSAYEKQGYTGNLYDVNITENNAMQFIIIEAKIGEIRIEGNKKTHDYVIRREMLFKAGDVYNEKAIGESLKRLNQLGIFTEVSERAEPGTEPGTLIVIVQVKEQKTGVASFGLGHSNIQGLIFFVDVADTNFRGRAEKISARIQRGADNSYTLSYTNPWIAANRTGLTVNVYNRIILRQAVTSDPDTDEVTTQTYDEHRSGFDLTLSRPISNTTRVFLTGRANRISGENPDDDPTTPDDDLPATLTQKTDVRSLALSAIRDTRDSPLYPTGGSYASTAVEKAGLFGGANFTKVTSEFRRYWILRGGKMVSPEKPGQTRPPKPRLPWVFATRLQAGTIGGTPPFLDQFLLGGTDSLRGYQEDRFPGKQMVLWNNELRIPITEALQLATFVDLGDAWGGESIGSASSDLGDPSFTLHVGYGVGVRVQTPIGPLRLDYGLNREGGKEFHFGVGLPF
ncbi:MAG: BamA/OMP85 family outer membrane protein [Armatimonadota bacterium]